MRFSSWEALDGSRMRYSYRSYGDDELRQAGAMRVFEDPADLLNHIDEVGGRR